MFLDSKIAKSFASSRTKAACILSGALMSSLKATAYIKIDAFSILNDGSSDTGLEKINVVCIHIVHVHMCITSVNHCSTFEILFNTIDSIFTLNEISWEQCVTIGLDNTLNNTNVNVGVKNSIKSRVQQRNKSCFYRL